jgi:2-polyprenyl-3-methyl-5-hydroxy-6-metoxy-1,4-benzoquinol methylase
MNDASRESYDRWHADMSSSEDDASAPWHRMAIPHLGDIKDAKVLEIGCGRGGFSRYLARQGANLVAADFSSEAVAIAERLLRSEGKVETITADIQEIPFAAEHFDLTVSLETLEHVHNPAQALTELIRVTKKGGRLLVSTPNYLSMEGLYRIFLKATGRVYTELGQPINQPLTLLGQYRAFKKHGCRIVAIDGRGFYLPVPKRRPIEFHPPLPRFVSKWFALHTLVVAEKQ